MAYQGRENAGHELEQAFPEQLPGGEREEVAENAEPDAQRDIRRVGDRRRDFVDEHVAGDPTADTAEQRHQQDADHREVPIVVGPSSEQGSVQRVR